MADTWKKFENECFEYLVNKYKNAQFEAYGKSDSTKPDIEVKSKQATFFIEVKSPNSQCCQFVLLPNESSRKFEFSLGNKVKETKNVKTIIEYMNKNFEKYKKVCSSGIDIPLDDAVFYGLVAEFYEAKKVAFFMTRGDGFIVFPLDSFSNYFDISACYRIKNSGSSEPNETRNKQEILLGLNRELKGNYDIEFCKDDNKKTRCILHSENSYDKKRVICENYTYYIVENEHSKQLEKKKNFIAEVRRLSNTSNPNVICQLKLKSSIQDAYDLKAFESKL